MIAGLKDVFAFEPWAESARRAGPTFWATWFVALALLLTVSLQARKAAVVWMLFGALSWVILFGSWANVAVPLFAAAAVADLALSQRQSSWGPKGLWFGFGLSAQLVIMDAVQHMLLDRGAVQTSSSTAAVLARWVLGLLLLVVGGTVVAKNWQRAIR